MTAAFLDLIHALDALEQFREPKPVYKKNKQNINISIESLQDLVDLAHHPLDKRVDYNIDLASLHRIRPELQEINNLIGLQQVKDSLVEQILYFLQHLNSEQDYKHMLLLGPPGTGKTELAILLGRLFLKMGILKNNIFKKVTRNDLVGGYLGQTAMKTKEVIQQTLGGILFIDEAYSLTSQQGDKSDSYAKECVDILCEAMSDSKSQLMVIAAGYETEMHAFLKSNTGLESRFLWRYVLPPYQASECLAIFLKKVAKEEWTVEEKTPVLLSWFRPHASTFKALGRDMEKWWTFVKIKHAKRMYGQTEGLKQITLQDMKAGLTMFQDQQVSSDGINMQSLYI